MRGFQRGRGFLAVAAVGALGLSVTACGSSDNSNSSTTSAAPKTTAASGAVKAATDQVAKFEAAQPAITLPAMSKTPPKGVKVAIMSCPLPVCKVETDGSNDAAKALGWTVKNYTSPLTPEGYLATWKQVLDEKPDVIAYTGILPNSAIKKQLAAAVAAKIPVAEFAANGGAIPSASGPQASYSDDPVFATDGDLMAAAVIADAGGKANAVVVNDPTFSYWTTTTNSFTKRVEAAGGKVGLLKVAAAGIGKTIPSAIVSYLQRNPSTKYVALAVNDFSVGLAGALKGAGLADKVKVIARAPAPGNTSEIAKGDQWKSVADENTAAGWRAIDGLARLVIGDPIKGCCDRPDGWHQIITKDNAVAGKAPQTPGVPDAFLKAWGLKG